MGKIRTIPAAEELPRSVNTTSGVLTILSSAEVYSPPVLWTQWGSFSERAEGSGSVNIRCSRIYGAPKRYGRLFVFASITYLSAAAVQTGQGPFLKSAMAVCVYLFCFQGNMMI